METGRGQGGRAARGFTDVLWKNWRLLNSVAIATTSLASGPRLGPPSSAAGQGGVVTTAAVPPGWLETGRPYRVKSNPAAWGAQDHAGGTSYL